MISEDWRKTRDDSAELRNRDREGKKVTTPNGEGIIKRELKVPTFSRLVPLKHVVHVTHDDGSFGEYDGKRVKLIKEGTEMTEQTVSLINAISQGDTIASAQLFNDALLSKVSDMIDARRQEVAQGMFEARIITNSSAILPASRALHDKNKSDLKDIGGTWDGKLTVLAVKTGEGKQKFIAGHGHGEYQKVGDTFKAHHNQTFKDLGHHKVENVIHLEGGKVIHHENEIGLNEKRPLSVYK